MLSFSIGCETSRIIRTIGRSSLKRNIGRVDLDYEVPYTNEGMRPIMFLAHTMARPQLTQLAWRDRSYNKIFRQRRLNAFVVSALTIFITCCAVTSLSVRGLVTTSEFTFSLPGDGDGDGMREMRRLVEMNLAPDALRLGVVQVSKSGVSGTSTLFDRDFVSLQSSIQYSISQSPLSPNYRLRLSLSGNGGTEERLLVENLTVKIARAFTAVPGSPDRICDAEDQLIAFKGDSRSTELAIRRGWNEIEDSLHQFEQKWLAANQQLNSIVDVPRSSLAVGKSQNAGPVFNQASFGKIGRPGFEDTVNALEELNTGELKRRMSATRKLIQAKTNQQTQSVIALAAHAKSGDTGSEHPVRTSSRPIGGVPGRNLLAVFGVSALAIGWVVSLTYRPELTDHGYASHKEVSDSLGLPVVAQMPRDWGATDTPPRSAVGFSNTFVACAEIALIGVVLLTIVTCLLEPVMRTSIIENPFHGLARMTWMFLGN